MVTNTTTAPVCAGQTSFVGFSGNCRCSTSLSVRHIQNKSSNKLCIQIHISDTNPRLPQLYAAKGANSQKHLWACIKKCLKHNITFLEKGFFFSKMEKYLQKCFRVSPSNFCADSCDSVRSSFSGMASDFVDLP